MSKVLKRATAMVAVMIASVVFVTTALAQMPTSPWKKGAPFPEPDEELYGVPLNGKLYVFGGWADGKAAGLAYEYDPVTDRWTKKTSMPRPAHHAALAAANGKIYVLGGFVPPKDTAIPVGGAWEPIDNAWEYDPAANSWKSLPPLPGKRGSAVAAEVGGKIYVIGGATTMEGSKDPFFTFFGPSRVLSTNEVYDPATNKWESRKPMSVPRNHAFGGVVNGKIYVIGGRTGHGFILSATNTDVVEEYNPINDSWSVPKERMPTASKRGRVGLGRPQDLRRRRRGDDQGSRRGVQERRGVRPGDQFVADAALHADAAARHRRRGDRQSLSPGERDDAVGRRADLPRPDPLHAHGDARHSGAAVRCASSDGCEERRRRLPRTGERPPLLVVWPDRQHEIGPDSSSATSKGNCYVESIEAGYRDGCRDDGQPGVRHDRAGSNANIPWKKGAPFPEPDEELYGVTTNGKLYVFGGWADGKAAGLTYEYDPATDKWTKKTSMPRPAHHAALAAANGKIYVMGGFVPPKDTAIPVGGAWEPIDNAWEYDPAADSWKTLPPLPGKRGSAIAAEVGGKIYVIGGATTMEGAKDPFFTFFGPSLVLSTNDVYDPATNKWASRKPMSVPRNHAFGGVVNGKIYVIGGRTGHGFILSATNTDVVEEYNPINDSWSVPKERMPTARSGGASGSDGRRIYVAGGEVTTKDLVGAFKSVEAYDPAINSGSRCPRCRCRVTASPAR